MIPGLSEEAETFIRLTLSQSRNVERAVLFGSRATGAARPGSDIDIALFGHQLGERDRIELAALFADSNLPYHVDLVVFDDTIDAELLKHVETVGKEISLLR